MDASDPSAVLCDADMIEESSPVLFRGSPFTILLENAASTARDHLANERTFLSWLRLSITLSVVSLAIVISFHLRTSPSRLEQRMAIPLGSIFWILSLLTLACGLVHYFNTAHGYASRKAVVEMGPRIVMNFALVAVSIIVTCILFILTNGMESEADS